MEGSFHINTLWRLVLPRLGGLLIAFAAWLGDMLVLLFTALWQIVSGAAVWLWRQLAALWHAVMRTPFGQKLRRGYAALAARIPAPVRRLWRSPAGRWGIVSALVILCFLPLYVQDIPIDNTIYVIEEGANRFLFIDGRPEAEYDSPGLYVRVDNGTRDAQIILEPGQFVTVRHGDEYYTAESRRETVANLLRRCKVSYGEEEMVAVDISGRLVSISISDVLYCLRDVPVPTDYRTEWVPNPIMDKGTEEVVQQGVPGTIIQTYRDTYRRGHLAGTTLLHMTDDTAVTEIIEYGTRVHEVDRSDRIREVVYNEGGVGGYLLFESGDTMTFSRVDTNSATAYYGGTKTATGHATGIGVIAVDPKVYPYGTRMFIQTVSGSKVYGVGTAYDCGGAVKGHIIDVWFPTKADCYGWGRRNCTCYILD